MMSIRPPHIAAAVAVSAVALAAPASADYYTYIDKLEANGLLVYGKPPRCIPQPQTDPICPQGITKIYGEGEAIRVGNIICNWIQSGGDRAEAIEVLTSTQGTTYSQSAASAIYDIAVTTYCWQ